MRYFNHSRLDFYCFTQPEVAGKLCRFTKIRIYFYLNHNYPHSLAIDFSKQRVYNMGMSVVFFATAVIRYILNSGGNNYAILS